MRPRQEISSGRLISGIIKGIGRCEIYSKPIKIIIFRLNAFVLQSGEV